MLGAEDGYAALDIFSFFIFPFLILVGKFSHVLNNTLRAFLLAMLTIFILIHT
jgi:hypothetical protein